jgi:hypothetical protein
VVHGHQESVELLVSKGASPTFQDRDGKSAVHLAAACGHLSCLATLLGNTNEDVSMLQDSQGCTALHWACYNGENMANRIHPSWSHKRNEGMLVLGSLVVMLCEFYVDTTILEEQSDFRPEDGGRLFILNVGIVTVMDCLARVLFKMGIYYTHVLTRYRAEFN